MHASAYFLHMLARRVPAPLCLLTQTLIGLYALNQPFDSMSKMSINPTHPLTTKGRRHHV